ncbi:MAG TPA: DUF3857 domain-containing protein, partial [bacterium]|nr:DUF3857 domain-containing protein [bacterium]
GKKKFAETELSYDSSDEKVEILYARTIKPDQNLVVPVGEKHIRDVSRYLNFPLYSNARVKIISFPEVEEGAVLEYRARYYQQKLIAGRFFVYNFGVQGSEPGLSQKLIIRTPAKFGLNWKKYLKGYLRPQPGLEPLIRDVPGKKEYVWDIGEIPEILEEERMPPWAEITDYVFISNFHSWDDIFVWWNGLVGKKLAPDQAIRKKVKALALGKKTLREKAMAVYAFVCENIRYVAVEYGEAGFEPHAASEIFMNKYGDCKDQAVLLLAMLREAGIKCYPVLIGTRGVFEMDPDFPTLVFNHAIACCEIDGEIIFMDPTSETVSFGDLPGGDQNRRVLVF